ncbi:MAG: PEGA domain-containing protein [Cytophagales bacterium]|nr:PEGA domain-containing protein [Cytophagales bacterium]
MKNLVILLLISALSSFVSPASKTILVKSDHAGAEVILNGYFVGKTPIEIKIDEKQYNFISVSKSGYKRQRVELKGISKEVEVKLEKDL